MKGHLQQGRISQETFNRAAAKAKGEFEATGRAVDSGIGGLARMVVTGGAVLRVATAIKNEWQKIKNLQAAAQGAQADAGVAMRKVQHAFTPDKDVSREQLPGELQKIADATGTPLATVAAAAEPAFSAAETQSNRRVLDTLQEAFRLAPGDAEMGRELAQRGLDVQNTAKVSPRASLGFLLQAARGSRVTNVAQFGKTGTRAISALVDSGDTLEEGAELFGATTSLAKDAEGSVSSTALIQLAGKLKGFVPNKTGQDKRGRFRVPKEQMEQFNAAKSTTARIGVLQRSPELRRQFLAENTFEAGAQSAFHHLLSGTDKGRAALASAQRKIAAPNEQQAAIHEQYLKDLEKGSFASAARFERQRAAIQERFNLVRSRPARTARARKSLDDVIDNSNIAYGPDAPAAFARRTNFESQVELGVEPETAAIREISRIKSGRGIANRKLDADESVRADQQIELLKGLLEEARKANQKPADPPAVVVPPQGKALGRNP
jgi:hypothetical protein